MNTPCGTFPQSIRAMVFNILKRDPFEKDVTKPRPTEHGDKALAIFFVTLTRLP
jgi:hypothetical protein